MRCVAIHEVPYTPMRSHAATYFKKEQCSQEAEDGKEFCRFCRMKKEWEEEQKKKCIFKGFK